MSLLLKIDLTILVIIAVNLVIGLTVAFVGTVTLEEALEHFASMSEENRRVLEKSKDFDELSKVAEKFINKWGNPHSVVIIEQGSIAYYEGAMANPLELLD